MKTERPKTEIVGRMPLRQPKLSAELKSKLTEDEIEAFEQLLLDEVTVVILPCLLNRLE